MSRMNKASAIAMFGSVKELADALGCSREAIYQWPDVLTKTLELKVMGAAVMNGKIMKK